MAKFPPPVSYRTGFAKKRELSIGHPDKCNPFILREEKFRIKNIICVHIASSGALGTSSERPKLSSNPNRKRKVLHKLGSVANIVFKGTLQKNI